MMNRFAPVPGRAATRFGLPAAVLAALLAAGAVRAQDATAPATAPGRGREITRWDLPRLFYDARQRRSLDAQERALRLGLGADGGASSGPRFDGWLTGPSGTHAWVSGTHYAADRSGRLHAAGQGADAGADELESGAQLDRSRGVLVVHRETEGTLHLRVGESDSPPDPAAAPLAGTDAR